MSTDRVNRWLTLAANLGVIVGIIFLVIEINQSTVTTRAEMFSSFQDEWIAIDLSWQNKEFAEAWAKAIENPEELTLTEMVQLNGFMWSYMDHITTYETFWDLGVFEEPQPSLEVIIADTVHIFMGNKFSQAWWAENKPQITSVSSAIIDREIENMANQNLDIYNRIKMRILE